MGRIFMGWSGLCVAAGLALQPAHASDRKTASVRAGGKSIRAFAFPAQARSSLRADVPQTLRSGVTSRRGVGANEFSFSAVNPLESRLSRSADKTPTNGDEQIEKAPTPPSERKTVRFFRLDPKLGDISVQPVVGGVNGAQLSMGF